MSKSSVDYPLTRPCQKIPSLSFKALRKKYIRTLKWYTQPEKDLSHHLSGIEQLSQVTSDEIVILTRQRNGGRFIRSFLNHYRDLGADRFIVVDEKSTDGTPEFTAEQSDVITLTAKTSYAEARRGKDWFDAVLQHLHQGQKTVVVDIDEYLVFPGKDRKLNQLFKILQQRGLRRLCAVMVDLYPATPVKNAVFDGQGDQAPWEVAPFFDTKGYGLRNTWQGLRLHGGVRNRVFNEDHFLTKFPVLFNQKRAIFDHSIHFPQPLIRNTGPVGAALLHFKYFSDFVEDHTAVVERGVHYDGGGKYQAVLDCLSDVNVAEEFDFAGTSTQRYEGPNQLADLGLIADL